MPFREFWIVSGSGLCLAVSPASVLGDKLLSADTFVFWTKRPDRGRWIDVPDKTDYSGKGYGASWVKLKVKKKSNEDIYQLTRIDKDLDFSLSFNPTNDELTGIDKNDLKIKLFKKSIWDDDSFKDDEYEANNLEKQQIEQLFQGQTESKVKTLLLSLSTRRFWKKMGDKNFFSLYYKPSKISDLNYTLKIKYFDDFEKLKNYVHKRVSECTDPIKCEATKGGLKILDQDTAEFYKDPE